MAGLLDEIFNTDGGRLGLGLLAAAMPSNIPAGQRLAGVMQMQDQFKAQKQAGAQNELRAKLLQSQIDENALQMQIRTAQQAAAERKQSVLPELFGAPNSQPQASDGASTTSYAPGSINWQRALQEGYSPDEIQKLAALQNLGKQKVARTIKGMGPDGREYEYQVDEFGQRVGDGVAQFRAPIMQDLGGKVQALDAYSLKPMQSFGKTMTPDGAANFGLSKQRLEMDRQKAEFERQQGGRPTFNAEAGGFIVPPSQTNPQGAIIPLEGFQKPMNDTQSKALLFGTRMQESDKVLNELGKKGVYVSTPGANAGWGIGGAINLVNSEDRQMLDQAKRDFINATLRRESGAAIADSEFASAEKQYFPQMGDSEKVIAQKARNRELATRGILAEVPRGAAKLTGSKESAKQIVQTGMYGGRKVVKYSDGSIDYAD